MRKSLVRKWLVAALLVGLNGLPAQAQNAGTGAPPAPESAPPGAAHPAPQAPAIGKPGQSQSSAPLAQGAASSPVGVEQLLKMLQAGVSKEVIRAYIDTAQAVPQLSAADIVTLKERGVPDDLTVALMKRKAELAAQARQTSASNAVPTKVAGAVSLDALVAALQSRQLNGGSLDPEGYDYFRYYYLTPRAIAAANEQVFSSYRALPGYPSYSYDYWSSPWAFRSQPFAPCLPGP
jgi:hypothetical protein